MSSESQQRNGLPSTFQGRKFAPKKIRVAEGRISFRDLAKFAVPRKTEQFLVDRTGCDGSTAKRWLSGTSRAPAHALQALVVDILSRIEL